MGAFTILAEEWEYELKIRNDFQTIAKSLGMRYFPQYSPINMQKDYKNRVENILWDLYNESSYLEYMNKYSHLEPEEANNHIRILPDGRKFFRLAMSDDTNDYKIMYDFAKEYLLLNPNNLILEEWSNKVLTLGDIKRIETEGGYYRDWFLKAKRQS